MDAYAIVDALSVPDDLSSALRDSHDAGHFFVQASPSYRRNVLRWIAQAKKSETRAKRIAAVVESSKRLEKVPQM